MPSAIQATEDASAAVAKTPNRITKSFIEHQIVESTYITGDAVVPDDIKEHYTHLTICLLRVNNGFIIIGKSAPMDPANYDAALGCQLAYEDAFRQLWPLYAFASLEDDHLWEQEAKASLKQHDDGETPPNPNSPAPAV